MRFAFKAACSVTMIVGLVVVGVTPRGVDAAATLVDIADPPMIVQVDRSTVAVTPTGVEIPLPAGSRIDACLNDAGLTLSYNLDPRMVRVLAPCVVFDPSAVFSDGFEVENRGGAKGGK